MKLSKLLRYLFGTLSGSGPRFSRKVFVSIIVFSCCFIWDAKATRQQGERLIVGEDVFEMCTLPIDQDSVLSRQLQKRLSGRISTGLYRGYVGTWRLEDGKLILEKVEEYDRECKLCEVDISGIFDAYRKNGRIEASWFTGMILAQRGRSIYWDGYCREYEIRYYLRDGVVKREKRIYNTLRKGSNDNYYNTMHLLFNGNNLPWEGDSTLRVEVLPNPDGTVNRVKVCNVLETMRKPRKAGLPFPQLRDKVERLRKRRNSKKAEARFWSKTIGHNKEKRCGRNHPCTREVMACAKLVGEWDVVTLDGKIQPVRMDIEWGKNRLVKVDDRFYREDGMQDSLDMEGMTYRVDAYPLQKNPDLITRLRPHLKGAFSSQQPRGYWARWKIDDDRLWLTEIRNAYTGQVIPLSVLVPGNNGETIEASWYTGTFEIARGEVLGKYYPLGNAETLEVICEIERGRVVRKTVYNNYIRLQENSVAYNNFIREVRSHDWDSYPELKDRSLHGDFTVYPRVDGVADSIGDVKLYVNGGEGENRYHRTIGDPADPWIKLVHHAALQIPRWKVICIKGEVQPVTVSFSIKQVERKQEIPEGAVVLDLNEILGVEVIGE